MIRVKSQNGNSNGMSNSALALLGGGVLLAIVIKAKQKIENLENQIRLLSSQVASISHENSNLKNIIRDKDIEINQLKETKNES